MGQFLKEFDWKHKVYPKAEIFESHAVCNKSTCWPNVQSSRLTTRKEAYEGKIYRFILTNIILSWDNKIYGKKGSKATKREITINVKKLLSRKDPCAIFI